MAIPCPCPIWRPYLRARTPRPVSSRPIPNIVGHRITNQDTNTDHDHNSDPNHKHNPNPDHNSDSDPNSDPDANSDPDPDPNTDPDPNPGPNPDSDPNTDPDPDPDPDRPTQGTRLTSTLVHLGALTATELSTATAAWKSSAERSFTGESLLFQIEIPGSPEMVGPEMVGPEMVGMTI